MRPHHIDGLVVDEHDLLNAIVGARLEELYAVCEEKRDKDFVEGTVLWFRHFEVRRDFFAVLFAAGSTVSFRYRLLDFIMVQLGKRLEEVNPEKNSEVLRKFMGMAVLGIVESLVLGQLEDNTEQVATRVGKLLEQIITD